MVNVAICLLLPSKLQIAEQCTTLSSSSVLVVDVVFALSPATQLCPIVLTCVGMHAKTSISERALIAALSRTEAVVLTD